MIKISFFSSYEQDLRELFEKESQLHDKIDISIDRFKENPHDTRLRTHALRKRLKGKYSFSITNDVRIVFEWVGKTRVRFLAIGSHTNAYGKKK